MVSGVPPGSKPSAPKRTDRMSGSPDAVRSVRPADLGNTMPADPAADVHAALEHLRSEFQSAATAHPDLRHVLIEAPDFEAYDEALWLAPGAFQGKMIAQMFRKDAREYHLYLDDRG